MSELNIVEKVEMIQEMNNLLSSWRQLGNAQVKCRKCEDITEHLRTHHFKINPKSATLVLSFHCLDCGLRNGIIRSSNFYIRRNKVREKIDVHT